MTTDCTCRRLCRAAAAIALAFVFAIGGCVSSGSVPAGEPLPADQSFEGVWYSPQFDQMYLQQDGDEVTGVYTYEMGGKLEGTADGNVLRFEWKDAGDKQTATRSLSGRGYFQLVETENGYRLKGQWGYDESRSDGGPWNADFIRDIDASDPTTLDELEQ